MCSITTRRRQATFDMGHDSQSMGLLIDSYAIIARRSGGLRYEAYNVRFPNVTCRRRWPICDMFRDRMHSCIDTLLSCMDGCGRCFL